MNTEREYLFAFRILGREILSLGLLNKERARDDTSTIAPLAEKPTSEIGEKIDQTLFVVNSLFLYECFEVLTQTEEENLHVVTGSATDNLRTLERIIPLQLSLQSVTGAAADNNSLANELIRLNEFGLLPLG